MFIYDQHGHHPTLVNVQAIADISRCLCAVGAQICMLAGHSAGLNA
jgi:hypothetical protein